ncbi:MAG TPA: hypothetical protein VG328_04570 [Stellaceae bacterium]|jgi:hypothetical protein|nr:hypothetical protein [Stellaceae bacterium]
MPLSENLRRLIDLNAPLWAGEAEIVRTYWTSPVRTVETDKLWIRRQCWKEFGGSEDKKKAEGGRLSRLEEQLHELVPRLEITVGREELREELEKAVSEYTHYCLYASVYDKLLQPGEPKLVAADLVSWKEESEKAAHGRAMRKNNGRIGPLAAEFCEGGYCTLFSEGLKLKGKPGIDGEIGNISQRIYNDEFDHMMHGVVGMDRSGLTAEDWKVLERITVEHTTHRIYMRNAQFSHPISDTRIEEIVSGKIEPIAFDYAKAESYLAHPAIAAE